MTTSTRSPRDQVSADTIEGVRAALAAYCHALDDGRTDDVVALFTDDGRAALPGIEPAEGSAALRALYRKVVPTVPQRHLVVNTVVTAGPAGEVEAVSDLLFVKLGEGGWTAPLAGRYVDVLRREGDRWLFVRRSLSFAGV